MESVRYCIFVDELGNILLGLSLLTSKIPYKHEWQTCNFFLSVNTELE